MKIKLPLLFVLIMFFFGCKENKYNEAVKMINSKNYVKGVEYLDDFLADDSTNSEAYLLRGKIKYELKDTFGCKSDIKKAASLGNKNAQEIYNQFFKPVATTEYEGRIQVANEFIQDSPTRPEGYYNLGNVYFDEREFNKAIELYDKTISVDKRYSAAYYNRGICYIYTHKEILGCKDIQIAAEMGYEQAIQALPECEKIRKQFLKN